MPFRGIGWRWGILLLTLSAIFGSPRRAAAHDVEITGVARVFLDQIGERRYALSVVDEQVPPIAADARILPDRCGPFTEAAGALTFECETPLDFDDVITLPWALSGVVVLARWSDGTEQSTYFRGDGGAVSVRLGELRAGAGSIAHLAGTYLALGMEHILFGFDHLLFVLGLLLLIRGVRPLVKTITAFTAAHSVTLGAAVFGWVPVDSAPVEAAIALSIVLLAREVVMGHRGETGLVHSRPWIVAFVFGLLHGLGFAGALGEIGLQPGDVPAALLFFNVGVEFGQLAFVGLAVVVYRLARQQIRSARIPMQPALGYALGALATFWFLERLPAIWRGF